MIDTLKISGTVSDEVIANLDTVLSDCKESISHKTGEVNISGTLRNLKIYTSGSWLNISGSLPKFYYGNNVQNMTLCDIQKSIQYLSDLLKVDLSAFKVRRFDVAYTFSMEYHPANYLQMLLYASKRFEKNSFNDGGNGVQFVNDSVTLNFYDKRNESKKKRGEVPADAGEYLLRYEWQTKRYPERILGRCLHVSDLCTVNVWGHLLKRYKGRYFSVIRSDHFGGASIVELDQKIRGVSYE